MLNAGAVSIEDYPGGTNKVTFDVDPTSYSPFEVPIRGRVDRVLDGTTVRQFLGLQPRDWVISLQGSITELDTFAVLWVKYRQAATGTQFLWRDWFGNEFVVVYPPGEVAFLPVPIPGSCTAFTYTLRLAVCSVQKFLGNPY